MSEIVSIFGNEFEYDFLSGWIKYNRIEAGICQEALAHGICSTSHLSYFENGKKRLRAELIEALLKKLKITSIVGVNDIGSIRQKFHRLMNQIESFEYEAAEASYNELIALEPLLCISPYNIEFNVYKLMYKILVERKSKEDLSPSIDTFDKIYSSLNEENKHLYMLVTGKFFYDNHTHSEGIDRLERAYKIKETPWINYRLGVAYCQNREPLKSIHFLEKALNSYSTTGRYRNSLECHSFLGSSYTALKMYDKAEFHYKSLFNGTDYFTLNKDVFGVYTNLANLYFNMGKYDESISYCLLAMDPPEASKVDSRWLKAAWHASEQPVLAACIYIEIHKTLNNISKCKEIFNKFLTPSYENFLYYRYLYSLYLSIFHLEEEIFYTEVTNDILPFYKRKGFLNIQNKLQLMLIRHLELKRKYKEANNIYKELLYSA